MKRLIAAIVLSAALSLAAPPSCSLVPGWEQQGDARHFTTDDLYEYMNGNSEGYFLYGFREMDGISCKSGERTFVIDVSTMEDAEHAYGMFVANMDPAAAVEEIGAAGQIGPRKAVFVKGPYYVEIAADPEGDHSRELRAFLLAIEKQTPGSTTKPAALAWFPPEEQTEPVRLVPQSVLGFRLLSRGYLAHYGALKLFVTPEESPAAAARLFSQIKERFDQPAAAEVGEEGFQANDRYLKGICFFRKGPYVAGAASAPDAGEACRQARKLAARLP